MDAPPAAGNLLLAPEAELEVQRALRLGKRSKKSSAARSHRGLHGPIPWAKSTPPVRVHVGSALHPGLLCSVLYHVI
jgi:hypothetical protein